MRTFTLIWFGQLVSAIGSRMTFFALTLWAWDATGAATTLALVGLFFQLPQIPTTLFAGVIVDRVNRKTLMLLGDATTAIATLMIGGLYLTQQLAIWHLYLVAMLAGSFSQIQMLAYQASLSLLVPQQQYTRAASMGAIVRYGSQIFAPALAGMLYPVIQLSGIVGIDLATFAIAFITLLLAPIPQPSKAAPQSEHWTRQLTFGFRHIWQQPQLKALLLFTLMFVFAHDLGSALYQPMILARTGGSAQALASVAAAAGVGGVAGAVIVSLWGGPKRRVWGLLVGYMGAGLSKLVFGLGRSLTVWVPAQVCSSLNFPLLGSCRSALWMAQVAPDIQGRVFAANSLVTQVASILATGLAGPLADRLFEPAMMSNSGLANWLSPLFGSGAGAGMAVLYTACSAALLLLGISGFFVPSLRAKVKQL
ncbi:MAG: MFS transporter [Cyanobacteria bacterium P01_H01_bin.162]